MNLVRIGGRGKMVRNTACSIYPPAKKPKPAQTGFGFFYGRISDFQITRS